MSAPFWIRSYRFRRAFAFSAVLLATGGLILYRASPSRALPHPSLGVLATGKNAVTFQGPGARGVFSLSHSAVLAGQTTTVFAELKLVADEAEKETVRAPLSLAVVLDTSGSMGGEKIEDAKRAALRLVSDMRDDDEIAFVRYSDTSELIQPLARVGSVRSDLAARIRALHAGGGTNIPGGLSQGLRALDEVAKGRVRRIVLVSDGLDGTRAQAESLARASFVSGITVSSLGIGLDFDESYMGAVAQGGHGNFAFVKDGDALSGFFKRELEQTAKTTIENARVMVELPRGMRFISASGADANMSDGQLELRLGSLFAGDERRVIVELAMDGPSNGASDVRATASWNPVGGPASTTAVPPLTLLAVHDAVEVERGRDGTVLASATSVIASKRQLEASNAYASGDIARATALAAQNEAALGAAMAAAPAAAATLSAQRSVYAEQKQTFGTVAPSSAAGKASAKAHTMKDLENLTRKAF